MPEPPFNSTAPKIGAELPAGIDPVILERNLDALASVDPGLFERLTWPVGSDHVRIDGAGSWQYCIHQTWHALEPERAKFGDLVQASLQSAAQEIGTPRRALLLGVGSGALLKSLLDVPVLREVRAWERDPWLLRVALGGVDVAEEIASRRLRLLLTTDLIGQRTVGSLVQRHPFLGAVYAREAQHLDAPSVGGAVALAAGGLFVDQLGSELSARGFAPWTVDLQVLSEEELDHSLRTLAARFFVAVNYTRGLARLSHEHSIALRVWEVDPASSFPRREDVSTANVRIHTHDRANLKPWRAAGFEEVCYLPLAADPMVRRGSARESKSFEYGLTFVGQSLVDNAQLLGQRFVDSFLAWRGESQASEPAARALLAELTGAQGKHFRRFLIPDLLAELAPGFRMVASEQPLGEDPAVLAGEVASSHKRLACLAALGTFGPELWGDDGWRSIESKGIRYHGPAGHGPELTGIYDRSTINLDVGRLYQGGIVTMRVFDALACGGFVLTEDNAALGELFDTDRHLATYSSLEELVQKAGYFLDHPTEAMDIAARGREEVLRRHTLSQRVDILLEGLV